MSYLGSFGNHTNNFFLEMKLNFVANENYLLVKVGRNTKNDTKKDDINAKVATRSQLVTSQCGKQPI